MNKNILKIGALALGMFGFGIIMNSSSTNAQVTGDVSLTINTGISECLYGTSLNLGAQDVKLDSAYVFSGDFTEDFLCRDYIGMTGGWVFYIASSDLTNGLGNSIASGNVSVQHSVGVLSGDVNCTGGTATAARDAIDTNYTLIERAPGTDGVCALSINTVSLKVDVNANQAPGSYTGTLTLTVPTF